MHEKIVYLNGSFVPESEARVSVLDMGFHAGDGVYDVTRTFRHKPFKLTEHNDRLFRSLKYTRIDCGMSQDEMEAACLEVLERNRDLLGPDDDYSIWQVVSRGARSSSGPPRWRSGSCASSANAASGSIRSPRPKPNP